MIRHSLLYPCLLLLASCLLLLLVSACATSQPLTVTREPVTLRLVVADSCGPLAEEISAEYEEARPWVTVEFEVFNNAVSEETLRAGGADLALLSWLQEPRDGDRQPLWAQDFARDGIAVIVHPDSPLAETGLAQLADIFSGRLQEWGGAVLTVVSRESGSGTRAAFESIVLGGEDPTLNAVVMPSSEAVVDYVANTPGAVGYVSTLRQDDRVRALPVEGAMPTREAVIKGEYPLPRTLYLAAVDDPTGEAREFAQWLLAHSGMVDW